MQESKQERSKLPNVRLVSGSEDADSESLSKYLFYTKVLAKKDGKIVKSSEIKYACFPLNSTMLPNRYFFASTRHGPHECLDIGDKIYVYDKDGKKFKVEVVFCHNEQDFIVFESAVKVCHHVPVVGPAVGGRPYIMLGFADINQDVERKAVQPCYLHGTIISSDPNELGHVAGSSGGISGFSGGPVFDLVNGKLVGMCVSTDDLDDRETTLGKFSSDMITYCKETHIVRIMPTQYIASVLNYRSSEG